MMTIYDSNVDDATVAENLKRLTNQIFRLLPVNEEGQDWLKPLDTILLEVSGLSSLFPSNSRLFELLSKLQGLKEQGKDIEFTWFRRIIFECCSMAQSIEKHLEEQNGACNVTADAQNSCKLYRRR